MNRGRVSQPCVRLYIQMLCAALLLGPGLARSEDQKAGPAVAKGEDQKAEAALGGYCPASFLLAGEAKKGSAEFQATHEGRVYYCADAAAKAAFEADPAKYLPQFNGLCTTALGGQFGNRMESDPAVFSVVNNKVYLFSSERARNAYARSPQGFIDTAGQRFEALPKEQRVPDPQFAGRKHNSQPAPQTGPAKPAMSLIGTPVPPAVFTSADGKMITTPEMTDAATLVMFYASWCGFCKKALPELDTLSKSLEGKSAKILAVSMDTLKESGAKDNRAVSRQEVLDQFKTMGVSLPQAFDTRGDGQNKMKVSSFPTMFLLDKAGVVQRVYMGITEVTNGNLKQDMEDLIAGKRLPPQPIPPPTAQTPPPSPTLALQGQPAPKGSFTSASAGSPYSLAEPGADATVAVFYASWCGFCKKALPELNTMSSGYQGKPVRFVGINQDTIVDKPDPANARAGKTKDEVLQQWRDMGIGFEQMLDLSKIGPADFKVQSYPTMFLIGKDGKIQKVYVGASSVTDGTLKKDIEALLSGNAS